MDRTRLTLWSKAAETKLLFSHLESMKQKLGETALKPGISMDEILRLQGKRLLLDELLDGKGLIDSLDRLARQNTEAI